MAADVQISRERETPALSDDDVARTVDAVLDHEGVVRHCLVSVSFVTDERIRDLNSTWRGVDRSTDVVSLECERPDDADLAPDEPCELGDIVLAPAYIRAQASRLGTDPFRESTLLLVHGMLHLLGYDHLVDEEARVMEACEDDIVADLVRGVPLHVELTRHKGEGDR
jgi:probable rRNA maturation factor